MTRRLSPLTASIRRLAAPYMTRAEAAAVLGIGESVLRRIDLPGVPGRYAPFGELQVGLYDDADLAKIRNHLAEHGALVPSTGAPKRRPKGGAPKRWTKKQLQERARLRQAVIYHRRRAAKHADNPQRADHHKARVEQAQEQLDNMLTIAEKRRQRLQKEN